MTPSRPLPKEAVSCKHGCKCACCVGTCPCCQGAYIVMKQEGARVMQLKAELAEALKDRSRYLSAVKGAHGALCDAGNVPVPGSLAADLYEPVMVLVRERDNLKAEIDALKALLGRARGFVRSAEKNGCHEASEREPIRDGDSVEIRSEPCATTYFATIRKVR